MYSQQFHSMNARIVVRNNYTAFISYATPQLICINGEWVQVNKKFSSTTSRQVNRFKREEGITARMLDREDFKKLCHRLGLDTGRV